MEAFFTPERIALLLCLAGGYLFGLIQTGFFIAKGRHVDIKHLGSGNTGATNIWRVMGPGWGLLTFVCDVVKVFVAVYAAHYILGNFFSFEIDPIIITMYTGLGTVLGHDFPAYLKFKGGKGIACSCAIFLCFSELKYIIVGAAIFFITLIFSRIVSISSLAMMISILITYFISTLMYFTYITPEWIKDGNIIMILLVAIAFFTHRKNIGRLLTGEELKFSFRKQKYAVSDDEYDEKTEDGDDVSESEEAEVITAAESETEKNIEAEPKAEEGLGKEAEAKAELKSEESADKENEAKAELKSEESADKEKEAKESVKTEPEVKQPKEDKTSKEKTKAKPKKNKTSKEKNEAKPKADEEKPEDAEAKKEKAAKPEKAAKETAVTESERTKPEEKKKEEASEPKKEKEESAAAGKSDDVKKETKKTGKGKKKSGSSGKKKNDTQAAKTEEADKE